MGENDAAPIQLCLTVFTVSFQKRAQGRDWRRESELTPCNSRHPRHGTFWSDTSATTI
jgi:hypothetical protein